MADTIQWSVQDTQSIHTIIYRGKTLEGNAKLTLDGIAQEFVPMVVPGYGRLVRQIVGTKDILLLLPNQGNVDLLVDGRTLNGGAEVDTALLLQRAMEMPPEVAKLNSRVRNGRGALLSMITLTMISMVLGALGMDWYFPFSAFLPRLLAGMVHSEAASFGGGMMPLFLFGGAAACMLVFYFAMYLLSARFTTPIWLALAAFVVDATFFGLVLFAMLRTGFDDATMYIIDAFFHVWILLSLISLLTARIKSRAVLRRELAAPAYGLPPAPPAGATPQAEVAPQLEPHANPMDATAAIPTETTTQGGL